MGEASDAGAGKGTDGGGIEFDGDGALEEIDGDEEVVAAAEGEQGAAKTGERPGGDFDGGTGLDAGPGEQSQAGGHDAAHLLDVGVGEGGRGVPEADEAVEAGGGEERQETGGEVEAAEEVAGEHGAGERGEIAGGQERKKALVAQDGADGPFRTWAHLEGEPGRRRWIGHVGISGKRASKPGAEAENLCRERAKADGWGTNVNQRVQSVGRERKRVGLGVGPEKSVSWWEAARQQGRALR